MKLVEQLATVTRLFLDTAPIIYFVEEHPRYSSIVAPVFAQLDAGTLTAVTSPVTLAECLVIPWRDQQASIRQAFTNRITAGRSTLFIAIDEAIADKAAELRAQYHLALADAFQLGAALLSDCDAFLTNDLALKRVTELQILVLDEFFT